MSIQNVDLAGEVVVIVNSGSSPQVMTGWELLSEEGGQRFVFPQLTLYPGAAVRVYQRPQRPARSSQCAAVDEIRRQPLPGAYLEQ